MTPERTRLANELVAREAQALDEQRWEDWLTLFSEDAVLWAPCWRTESELTSDPLTELSFFYLEGRKYLAERVFRVVSGRSVASVPVPRTVHLVTGSVVDSADLGRTVCVSSAWSSHVYHQRQDAVVIYSGRYQHDLQWQDDRYRIRRKKIVLNNDVLSSKVDFFYF